MIRLGKVELRRLFARRLTLLGMLAATIITGVLLFAVYQDAKPLSDADLQQQRVQFEQSRRQWEAQPASVRDQAIKQCKADQATARQEDPTADFQCEGPTWESWGKPEPKFAELAPDYLLGIGALAAFAAFLIGAGFVGAEFTTGSIGNWLTFEPRRLRVYTSKLIAAGSGLAPVAAALVTLLVAGAWLIVGRYGSTAGTRWSDLTAQGGRAVALAAAAAIVGAVLAGLLRHTAAAVGVAMGYLVLIEGVFSGALEKFRPWLLSVNFESWIGHGATYWVNRCTTSSEGLYDCQTVERHVSFGHSAGYLAVLCAVLVVLGAVVFRRRDVN
jgi:ABC-2 type transport system permease protein